MCPKPPVWKHPRLAAVGKYALIGVGVVVLAVPYACVRIYSFAKYGRGGRRHQHGCVRRGGHHRRYTEDEWRKLKLSPEPEFLNFDLIETQQDREEHEKQEERQREDRIMGISSESEHGEATSASDVTRRKWKPKRPFRFMDLPSEVQILVLENLVVEDHRKKWVACAGYCKDGFISQNLPPKHSKPVYMKDTLALWRAGSTTTTRSLLLTSRQMRESTNATLASSFSGQFQFHSRQRTSQLDAPWPWDSVTPQTPVVLHNKWLFDHVRTLETPQIMSVWSKVLSVMPKLERIKLTPQNVYGKAQLDEAFMSQGCVNWEILKYPMHLRKNVLEAGLEAGHHWIEWCKQRKRDGLRTVTVSIVVKTGRDDAYGFIRACTNIEVQLWPRTHVVDKYVAEPLEGF